MIIPLPPEVGQPSTPTLPDQTGVAGPTGKSLRSSFARPPRPRKRTSGEKGGH